MSEMTFLKILLILTFSPLIARLVLYKNDQQFVHMLEGALFKNRKDISLAKPAYARQIRSYSTVAIVIGFTIAMIAAFMFSSPQDWGLWATLGVGLLLIGTGIFQRMSAFRAAARELGVG